MPGAAPASLWPCTYHATCNTTVTILDANYLHRDTALGENAIRKLEAAQEANKTAIKFPN